MLEINVVLSYYYRTPYLILHICISHLILHRCTLFFICITEFDSIIFRRY